MTTHSPTAAYKSVHFPPPHQFGKSSSLIFPNLVDKATVALVHLPPICDKVKYLLYLSINTNFFNSVSVESMVTIMTDWCLELLLGMKYHVRCWTCILPFNLVWSRHITIAFDRWEWHLSTRHKAAFLSKNRVQVAQSSGALSLSTRPRHLPTSDLQLLFQASKSWLSSREDVVHLSFPGSSVASQVSHLGWAPKSCSIWPLNGQNLDKGEPVSTWGEPI